MALDCALLRPSDLPNAMRQPPRTQEEWGRQEMRLYETSQLVKQKAVQLHNSAVQLRVSGGPAEHREEAAAE